jgi:hypothetical protein
VSAFLQDRLAPPPLPLCLDWPLPLSGLVHRLSGQAYVVAWPGESHEVSGWETFFPRALWSTTLPGLVQAGARVYRSRFAANRAALARLPILPAPHYTTWGPLRGGCGHRHRTWAQADRCARLDRSTFRLPLLPGVAVGDRVVMRIPP